MGRRSKVPGEVIIRICKMWKDGFCQKAIAENTGVSLRSVQRWLKTVREAPSIHIPLQRDKPKPRGMPLKVTQDILRVIKQQLNEDPGLTARKLKKTYPQMLGNVSRRTVNGYIKVCTVVDEPTCRGREKSQLTERYTKLRYAFAKKYSSLTLKDVRTILWTDEATFSVTGITSGGGYKNSDRIDPSPLKTVKTVTVWGAFSYYGLGKLVFIEDGAFMNGPRYLELLYDNLVDCFDVCQTKVFQHDCVPFHTNNCVWEWLDNCDIDYILDWPPNSPDLNPIEDLWFVMRKELLKRDTRSLSKLKESIINVWESLSSDLLQKLVDSFPERLKDVIRQNGNTIIRPKLVSVNIQLLSFIGRRVKDMSHVVHL